MTWDDDYEPIPPVSWADIGWANRGWTEPPPSEAAINSPRRKSALAQTTGKPMTNSSIPQDETEGTPEPSSVSRTPAKANVINLANSGRRLASDASAPAPSSPPSGETSDYTRFSHWSTDLLSKQLRDLMATLDDPSYDLLNAVADRLDALYFGEEGASRLAPEPRSAVPETPTLDTAMMEGGEAIRAALMPALVAMMKERDEARASLLESERRAEALETAWHEKQAEIDDLYSEISAKVSARDFRIQALEKELAAARSRLSSIAARVEVLPTYSAPFDPSRDPDLNMIADEDGLWVELSAVLSLLDPSQE